jgi:dihydrofolate reductase
MRTIVHAIYVSLDGVVSDPAWTGPFFNDELAALQRTQLFASDALLLGRVTYEAFASSWPTMTDEDGFAERMNSLPKYVASRTLAAATWNATVLRGDVEKEVARLKGADGGDLLIYGSSTLADVLTEAGLIDEYRLMVFPVVVGHGARLFAGTTLERLHLGSVVTTTTGVAMLTYRRTE